MKALTPLVGSRPLACFAVLALAACGSESSEPPDVPALDAFDSPTNQNPITLTGTGEPGATIRVSGSEGTFESLVGGDGSFSVAVTLEANATNALAVTQLAGAFESEAVAIEIVHDDLAPETPTLDPVASPTRRSTQTIRGMAQAGTAIVV